MAALRASVKRVIMHFPGKPKKVNPLNNINYKKINKNSVELLIDFIKDSVRKTSKIGLKNVVVGLSGGVDSVVIAALCKKALGKNRILLVTVESPGKKYIAEVNFAQKIAKKLGIKHKVIKAGKLLNVYKKLMKNTCPFSNINIRTRIIHNLIFQVADNNSAIVAATTDKSEYLLGRQTELFYGHVAPLINLYKTEVSDLAKLLKIPSEVLTKKPGCVEWRDEEVFGVPYNVLDPIIFLLAEQKYSVKRIATEYKIDKLWLSKLKDRIDKQHFRTETQKLYL